MTPSPVALHYEESGGGLPVIIMHGLLGSLTNWRAVARSLAGQYRVINLDLRSHGQSPWTDEMSYSALAADVLALMDRLGLAHARLLGHSLGGKLAMVLADLAPERFTHLAVIDIAPKAYPAWHQEVFSALRAVDLAHLRSREAASAMMAAHLFDPAVRAFLTANLVHSPQGWRWRFNLDALQANYPAASQMPDLQGFFCGATLFVRGAQSAYITDADIPLLAATYPQGCLHTLSDARHWPHIEAPEAFIATIRRFFAEGCAAFAGFAAQNGRV
ncbi:alpha/beta fold hydrolase [Halothiobacillus sp. DCM-1]|uniref:alpha/beta fold hydrolase n=1 Tax=Halothiobacillus sp. DCM-1 TaxID=3112558 RepID=UPI00324D8AB2